MTKNQSLYILPKIHDFGGDLSKQWYIEYSVLDTTQGKKVRHRISDDINKVNDLNERYALCEKVITSLSKKIRHLDIPELNRAKPYDDCLLYDNDKKMYGSTRISEVTVRTYLSAFLKRKELEVTTKSYITYQSKLRIFCEWCEHTALINKHVSTITNSNICDFFRYIVEKKGLSRLTVLKYRQILFNFFKYLQTSKKIIDQNPVYDIPRVGKIVDEAPVPIPEKIRKILKTYMLKYDKQLWLVCMMEFYCAIRPGEELRLMKVGDINFETHSITIRQEIAKNRKKETVDMPQQLYCYLTNYYHLNEYPQDYYLFSQNGIPGTDHLGKNSFRNRFDRIRDELNLPPYYKLYSFKHSGAVELIKKGFSTYDLQRHFRHKSIVTTEQYFRKNIGEHNEKMINDFPDI